MFLAVRAQLRQADTLVPCKRSQGVRPMETAIRLIVPAESVAALRRHPLVCQFALSTPRKEELHDTYFDTPELQVRAHNALLRTRQNGAGSAPTATLALANSDGRCRREWTARISTGAPDLAVLRGKLKKRSKCGALVRDAGVAKALAPVFGVYVQHTVWALRLADGDELELALDEGFVECGAQRFPVSEVDIALKAGEPARLFDFALGLQQDIALRIASSSTAERGYRLAREEPPPAVKATPLALSKDMTVEQAFQCLARNCLAQVCANQDGVATGHDAECVHQMRVGLRRLKSALRSFRSLMQLPETLQQELDWLTGELGGARDWDVLADTTLAAVADEMAEPGELEQLRNAAANIARDKHQEAAAAVYSQRYTRLMLHLARWIDCAGWRDGADPANKKALKAAVKPFARGLLRRDRARLLRRGRKLAGGDPAARHRVRIAGKKTRYDTEFFQSLFGKGSLDRYIKALTTLQDELGMLNDAAVAARLLAEIARAHDELAPSAQFVGGYLAARIELELPALLKRWKKLAPVNLPV
jgi:inorganic triphosphatase YgiF